jgi:hypothetical protein
MNSTDRRPIQTSILDMTSFVRQNNWGQVTSFLTRLPSSSEFHPEGLFSEEIFGQIGTQSRMTQFGFIELNTSILAPELYKDLIRLGGISEQIMAGKIYAKFDEVKKTFIKTTSDDPDGNTGFTFFMTHYRDASFVHSESDSRNAKINLLDKFRLSGIWEQFPVIPAGIRDIDLSADRPSEDDINSIYRSIMSLATAIPPKSNNPIYDSARYSLQKKALEIYEYIANILLGKRGLIQGSYGSRKIAFGTRNVITASSFDSVSPDHIQTHDPRATKVALFQTIKGMTPLIKFNFAKLFIDPVFGNGNITRIALVNPETCKLSYKDISHTDIRKFTGRGSVEVLMNKFKNYDFRFKPISFTATDGSTGYLCMVYDTGDTVSLYRSITDVMALYPELSESDIMKYSRPLTYAEAFYISGYNSSIGRYCFITRYPAIQDGSCYPSKIHLTTTGPARVVVLKDLITNSEVLTYPEYPILGGTWSESVQPHSSQLAGLGADFDGDMTSVNFVYTDEAVAEIDAYFEDLKSVIDTRGQYMVGGPTDLMTLVYANMTRN